MDKRQIDHNASYPTTAHPAGTCGLRSCQLNPCPLKSHQSYVKTLNAVELRNTSAHSSRDPPVADPRLLTTARLLEVSAQQIDWHFTDLFPTLPFETRYVDVFRDLMYYWFTDHVHRVSRVFAPHVDPVVRARSLLEGIYTSPAFAVCVLGNSQTDKVMRRRQSTADWTTRAIYSVLIHVLKERIETFRPPDIPWLLLLVVALAGLEPCLNPSVDGMRAHRAAIDKLVTISGGIHAVGKIASNIQSHILNTDRFIALYLGEYPLYRHTLKMAGPNRPTGRYGKAFANLIGTIDLPIAEFSEAECQLIDMLEVGGVDLTVTRPTLPTWSVGTDVLPNFLHLREKIAAEHAILYARYHENQVDLTDPESASKPTSISRCVMLAGHMVFYTVAFADYYTNLRAFWGSEVESILQQKSRSEWMEHKDVIIWILFVLSAIPAWAGHLWSIAELRLWLNMKYNDSWPHGSWVAKEASTVCGFVWSERDCTDAFNKTCAEVMELEKGLQSLHVEKKSENARETDSKSTNDADDEGSGS